MIATTQTLNTVLPLPITQHTGGLSLNLDLNALISDFIDYLDTTEKTRETYLKGLRSFSRWTQENGVKYPQREDLLRYRDQLSLTAKPTTINSYLVAIRQFFAYLSGRGLYQNIAEKVKGLKLSRDFRKDALTLEQARNLLSQPDRLTAAGRRDYALLLVLLTGALRTIEVSRANLEDLDQTGGQVVLFVQGKGRSDKADSVILPDQVVQAIRDYLTDLPLDQRYSRSPLFQSRSNQDLGGRLTTRAISGIVKKYLLAAGINSARITAHSLRHTAVTLALLNGQTLQEAQQYARHSSINTTTIYAHNLDKSRNQCSRSVAQSIFG